METGWLFFVPAGFDADQKLTELTTAMLGYGIGASLQALFARVGGGLEVVDGLVRRIDTESQTSLDRIHRQSNVKNAFAIAPKAAFNRSQRYILIDDVFTTGATLNACSAQLRKAGVEHLDVLTLAHG